MAVCIHAVPDGCAEGKPVAYAELLPTFLRLQEGASRYLRGCRQTRREIQRNWLSTVPMCSQPFRYLLKRWENPRWLDRCGVRISLEGVW